MERLSSGLRINTAGDDAAGLAIVNRMTSQVLGLNQSVRNANDGISLIQTAEGALSEATNIMQRMRELSIQAANGIYSDGDRATLNAEVSQLKQELDRIAESTAFNGQTILDGSLKDVALQVGNNANQTINFGIGAFSAGALGGAAGDIVGAASAAGVTDLVTVFSADGDMTVNDVNVGAVTANSTLNTALGSLNSSISQSGVEFSAFVTKTLEGVGDGALVAGTDTLTLTVKDGDGNDQIFKITGTSNMDELVDKINSDTSIEASLTDSGRLTRTAEGATSITVADGSSSQSATGASSSSVATNFSLVLSNIDGSGDPIKLEIGSNNIDAGDVAALGLNVSDDDGNLQGEVTTTFTKVEAGDLLINGVEVGAITAGGTAAGQATSVINAINQVASETGVIAFAGDTSGAVGLRSTTGGEISVAYADSKTNSEITTLVKQTGLKERNSSEGTGSVSSINISTATGAQKAIGILDKALEQLNNQRSELGAINNRLDFTVNNLTNVAENTAASRSRIQDADFAVESANLSRAQILQQAGTAMLAQANAAPQQVLSLLQ